MNEAAARTLLEERLKTLGWEDQTAWEAWPYTPKAKVPYQEVTTVFGEPDPISLADSSHQQGLFQVRLLYPPEIAGTEESDARAAAIKALFPRNLILSSPQARLKIMREPQVTGGGEQGGRAVTIIRIRFSDR